MVIRADPSGFAAQEDAFVRDFHSLTGHPPFHWQQRLFARLVAGDLPAALDLPTGLGKTSVIAIWLLARAANADPGPGPRLPRRLVYVVDRRVVVDQATAEAEKLRTALDTPELARVRAALGLGATEDARLPLSTLRGKHVDNRQWLADPGAPAIIVGTIDMIGSRLLFEGYGVSRGMRPFQAGLLGADTLVVLDEAHLCPPFEALLRGIETDPALKPRGEARRAVIPGFRLLALSATGRAVGEAFRLQPEDIDPSAQPLVHQRCTAGKRLALHDLPRKSDLVKELAAHAWALGEGGQRVLVFCDAYQTAQEVEAALRERIAQGTDCPLEMLVGKRRVREREDLAKRLTEYGFLHPATGEHPARDAPAFLIATSAGEVGIDIDADHMVCDLVAWERMVQRLGRVNRRGGTGRLARIDVLCPPPEDPTARAKNDERTRSAAAHAALLSATRALLEALPRDGYGRDGDGQHDDGRHDASPRALAALKEQLGAERIDAATTPAPLRPALDRAVVDAWSLTSLPEHPGRPEPEPWLRGWVDEEGPQVQVIWRRHLPWRQDDPQPADAEIKDFFQAARPHLSEILEAPVDSVIDTLAARARTLVKERAAASDAVAAAEAADPATRARRSITREGLIVLTPARELKRLRELPRDADPSSGCGAWTVEELAKVPSKGKSPDKEALCRLLSNATILVSASLGGLDGNGLLNADAADGAAEIADASDRDEAAWPRGFRVLHPNQANPDPHVWKDAFRLSLDNGDEDEPKALCVLVERRAGGGHAGDPAISRRAQSLHEHGAWAAQAAAEIADALALAAEYKAMLIAAARVHDIGKARDLWQNAMRAPRDAKRPYAKTTAAGDPARLKIGPYTYRHEFGSLRDAEADPALLAEVPRDLHDLTLHLIAAHHGYSRPLIAPVDPTATPSESAARAAAVALRFARLQRDWGPWGLAWWEALLRAADWRASARNDAAERPKGGTADTPQAPETPAALPAEAREPV